MVLGSIFTNHFNRIIIRVKISRIHDFKFISLKIKLEKNEKYTF